MLKPLGLTDQIQSGLIQQSPNLRTIVVALDLSCAFDTTYNHGKLFCDVIDTTVVTKTGWLANYLRGRQTFVELRNISSLKISSHTSPMVGNEKPQTFSGEFYIYDLYLLNREIHMELDIEIGDTKLRRLVSQVSWESTSAIAIHSSQTSL